MITLRTLLPNHAAIHRVRRECNPYESNTRETYMRAQAAAFTYERRDDESHKCPSNFSASTAR